MNSPSLFFSYSLLIEFHLDKARFGKSIIKAYLIIYLAINLLKFLIILDLNNNKKNINQLVKFITVFY